MPELEDTYLPTPQVKHASCRSPDQGAPTGTWTLPAGALTLSHDSPPQDGWPIRDDRWVEICACDCSFLSQVPSLPATLTKLRLSSPLQVFSFSRLSHLSYNSSEHRAQSSWASLPISAYFPVSH